MSTKTNKRIELFPRFNKPDGVKTADYKIGKEYFYYKHTTGSSSQLIYHNIEKAKGQSYNFIINITNISLSKHDIYEQLDDIENMYDLNKEDVKIIDEVNKDLIVIKDDHHKMLEKVKNKATPYSSVNDEVEKLSNRLKQVESTLDIALKSLGNMYEDEQRAREQLEEIERLLKECKEKMREYKLPVIEDRYFVELSEANEAILEVIKELSKKPIAIKTLNTRVDTARDLVLKVYNTSLEIVKTASMAENAIVYGNRYRAINSNINNGLTKAEREFNKGNFKESLEYAINSINVVEPGIHKRLLDAYKKERDMVK